jgi:protoheme IX farnesyltransferase
MSTAIAFSGMAGYIIYNHSLDMTAVSLFFGILLLAAAATALNQYQERHFDALMTRTQNRPLPSKQMAPRTALIIAVILFLKGMAILYFLTNPITALLGLFNIVWYNGVYTPLKRRTSYVVLIGAVTGAIPPIMGWTAAGGYLLSPEILFIAAFMFFWQIPHFCLLLLIFKDDYKKAGFPSITTVLSEKHVRFIVFIWLLGTSVSTLFFPFFHIISGRILIVCLILLNIILILSFYRNAFGKNITFNIRSAFGSLYLYQVTVLVMLIIHALK